MSVEEFYDDLEELSSAEDFLNYFEVQYDQKVVHVNRLHILQRFHDYLEQGKEQLPEDNVEALTKVYHSLLTRAYQDFVESNAVTEKVFKVFKDQEQDNSFVPVEELLGP